MIGSNPVVKAGIIVITITKAGKSRCDSSKYTKEMLFLRPGNSKKPYRVAKHRLSGQMFQSQLMMRVLLHSVDPVRPMD
jgi:hypothetical protein